MKKIIGLLAFIVVIFLPGCASKAVPQSTPEVTQKPVPVTTQTAPPASTYYTGTGGKGMSLGIGTPKSQGLSADQAYLPTLVQGILVDSISKYSAVKVLDRVSLDRVIAETLDPTFADNLDIVRLGHVAQVGNWLTGNIIRTSSGYTLQLNITDTTPNAVTVASYTGACTVADFDDHSAIHKAALTLLDDMGIALTDKGKTELEQASSKQYVQAQTALSQGIVAQRKGTEVAALSYYLQAAAFDPSLKEAASRVSVASANIKSGNMGVDARNDIQWRKDWIARLTETEEFFDKMFKNRGLPYTLFYSTGIEQGKINYQTETMDLSFPVNLRINYDWVSLLGSVVDTVQAVDDGLEATNRRDDWGLRDWPGYFHQAGNWDKGVTSTNPFNKYWKSNFLIVFELLNNQNRIIGKVAIDLLPYFIIGRNAYYTKKFEFANYYWNGYFSYHKDTFDTLAFNAVKVDDISDNLTIRIASVNGLAPEKTGLKITALSDSKWQEYKMFSLDDDNAITGIDRDYFPSNYSLVIPPIIWDKPITSIRSLHITAYKNIITSITIPNSVTSIGENVEWREGGVENVLSNKLTSITIGTNVSFIGQDVIENGFEKFYKENGRKAGTYTFNGKTWSYRGR